MKTLHRVSVSRHEAQSGQLFFTAISFARDPQQLNIPPPLCFRAGFLRISAADATCCRLAMAELCNASPPPPRVRAPIMRRLPGAEPIDGRLTERTHSSALSMLHGLSNW